MLSCSLAQRIQHRDARELFGRVVIISLYQLEEQDSGRKVSRPGASKIDRCALIPGVDAVEVQGHAALRSGGRASEGRGSGSLLLGVMSRLNKWCIEKRTIHKCMLDSIDASQ